MLLAVAHDPVARTQCLKRAEDERDPMLNLLVGIFDDAVIRHAHQTRGQTLHILAALHFTQAACRSALAQQIVLRLRQGPL